MYNEKQPDYNYKSRLTDPHQLLNPLELQQELKPSGGKTAASLSNDQLKIRCARSFTLSVPMPKAGPFPEATFAQTLTKPNTEVLYVVPRNAPFWEFFP